MENNLPIELEHLRIEVRLPQQQAKQELIVVESHDKRDNQCKGVCVRKFQQVQFLEEYINTLYGGFIIPIIHINSVFQTKKPLKKMLPEIQQYLNDLSNNHHCRKDKKLSQFLLESEVSFPTIQRFDKVLTDAAIYSRRYLNVIFTRKQASTHQNQEKQYRISQTFKKFKSFQQNFNSIRGIICVSIDQHECLEELVTGLTEIIGGLNKSIQPIEFITPSMRRQIKRIQKLLLQSDQAYARWQVLRESVKQLKCNIYKGLHEDNAYYDQKHKELEVWSKSLQHELGEVIFQASHVLEKIALHFEKQKIYQNSIEVKNFRTINSHFVKNDQIENQQNNQDQHQQAKSPNAKKINYFEQDELKLKKTYSAKKQTEKKGKWSSQIQ